MPKILTVKDLIDLLSEEEDKEKAVVTYNYHTGETLYLTGLDDCFLRDSKVYLEFS
jgi:hypothetical protein